MARRSTSTRYSDIANKIGQYVHDHIDQEIGLDSLADQVGVSRFHLNRVFQGLTGFNLGQYIQFRKLGYAYELLSSGSHNVIDAGLAVGYESHSAFSRAFFKMFGQRPNEVKLGQAPSKQLQRSKRVHQDQPIEADIVELPDRTIVGVMGKGFQGLSFVEASHRSYETLDQHLDQLGLGSVWDYSLIGVSIDNPWHGEQAECRFFSGIDLDQSPQTLSLETYHWQAGRWARFVHHGAYRLMWQTISRVYSGWVIPNEVVLRDSAVVQVYVNVQPNTPDDELETHLYFGIET